MIDRLIDIAIFITFIALVAALTRQFRPQQRPAPAVQFFCHTCHQTISPMLVRHTARGPEHLHATYTQANRRINVGHAVTLKATS